MNQVAVRPLTDEQRRLLFAERLQLETDIRIYKERHKREFQIGWYPWQKEAFKSFASQIMTMCGNRGGKTMAAGFQTACDMTGDYPDWWTGFRQTHAPYVLAMGVDNLQLKIVLQKELFGMVTEKRHFSGGWIHPDEIVRIEWSGQVTGLAQSVTVKGKYGKSTINLRPYSATKVGTGSLSLAGPQYDLIWIDECPPDDLIGQLNVRTMTGNMGRGGRIRYTMTPELGATGLVTHFMEARTKGQQLIGPISWAECSHLTPEVQEQILAAIPEHEREMRSKGVPFFGSGLVYPIAESRISVPDFRIPPYYRCIRAIDLGINNPTAIVWLAHSPEDDVVYLVKTYSVKGENAATHAAAANAMWSFAPMVFPHDIDTTEKGSGKTIRRFYNDAGLTRTLDFKNIDGSISVEPGIFDINERMRDGRFKVFESCTEYWREFRMYHRQEGKLVKANDHVMDAKRYGTVMVTRYGVPLDRGYRSKPKVIKAMA